MKVFISSTSLDLSDYREAAIEVCLKLDLQPVAMEFFTAMGVGANEGSKRKLGESDVYVGIFAYRYGYIEDGYETSVTENEFDYAGQCGLDRLCFVVDPKFPWPEEARDYEHHDRHVAFLARVNKLIRASFTSVGDFTAKLTQALVEWTKTHPDSNDRNGNRRVTYRGEQTAILVETEQGVQLRPPRFFGRKSLTHRLHIRLDHNERVLLQGFGGTGKTALAAEIAAQRISRNQKPVLWLRAGDSDADTLLEAMARAFGRQQELARYIGDAKINACLELLQDQNPRLIVLDNLWNEQAITQVICAIPHQIPLLVTSRVRLGGLVRESIGNLTQNEALDLLGSLHNNRKYRKNSDAQALCKRLGNLAFAVFVAGQTLARDDLTPKELLTLIDAEPFGLELPDEFAREGYRSIADLLKVSLDRLEHEAQAVFLGFGAFFSSAITPELLARYMNKPESDIERILRETLQRKGLTQRLVHEETEIAYYRIHDLAYSYARGQQHGIRSMKRALSACRSYACNCKSDTQKPDVELANLLGACEKALEVGNYDILIDIMVALTGDTSYFAARGHTPSSLRLLNAAAAAAQDLNVKHAFLCELGYAHASFLGDLDKGYAFYVQALDIARKANSRSLEAMTLSRIGTVIYQQSKRSQDQHYQRDQEKAVYQTYRKAKRIAEQQADPQALSLVLQHIGFFYMTRIHPNYEVAAQLSDRAANMAASCRIHHIYFHALRNRGGCELELGRQDETLLRKAIATHDEAYEFARDKGNLAWMADALESKGEDLDVLKQIYSAQGLLDQARTASAQAQTAFEEAYALWIQIRAVAKAESLEEFMGELGYERGE